VYFRIVKSGQGDMAAHAFTACDKRIDTSSPYEQAEKVENSHCGTFEWWDSLSPPNSTLTTIERKVIGFGSGQGELGVSGLR
jgi:hypothetical protein